MNDQEKHQIVRDTLSEDLKKRLYLYSYIFLIVLAVVAILLSGINLIVDSSASSDRSANQIATYVAIALAVVSLVMIAWLSALYFVQGDEVTPGRIKAVGVLRILLRLLNALTGIAFMVCGFLTGDKKGWDNFYQGWGIGIAVVEGILFLYEIWKYLWIQENPQRYATPSYVAAPNDLAPKKEPSPARKPAAPKKEIPDSKVIEVETSTPIKQIEKKKGK